MNKGIAVAGNMIMDVIKTVSTYPNRSELTRIHSVEYSGGGAVTNTIRDLARLDPAIPLKAIALVGEDSYGDKLIEELNTYPSIDTSMVGRKGISAFCDAMAETIGKTRTFFLYGGANSEFDIEHVPVDKLDCDMFHIGYILLLDKLDAPDDEYGTRMARLLHDVQARGIRTSVDVVTEAGERFSRLVPPSLRYTDYLIINELEAGATVGVSLRDENGKLLVDRMHDVLCRLKEMGVARWAVIHAPEGGFALDENNTYVECPGAIAPDGFIVGSVGAGDAFCAGVLAAAYRERPIAEALEWGTASALCSLRAMTPSSSVPTVDEALKVMAPLSRRVLRPEA